MANLKRPGTYIEEVLDQIDTSSGVGDSVAAFLGAHHRGPSEATLISSWTQFVTKFGGFPATGTASDLAYAVYAYFAAGGSQAYVSRVVHADAVTATLTLDDDAATDTLRIDAKDDGTWGNAIYIAVTNVDSTAGPFDIIVYYGGSTDAYIVERWEDLSMADADDRYVEKIINSVTQGSAYIVATDLDAVPAEAPVALAATTLASGSNGTAAGTTEYTAAVTEGTSPLDAIESRLDVNLPNVTTASVINAATAYVGARVDTKGFVLVDCELGDTPSEAVTYRDTLTDVSFGALYYPRVWTSDPTSSAPGATRLTAPGALAMAVMHRTDTNRGVHKAPAGEIDGRIAGAVKVERVLSKADRDLLNINNVNAIHNVPRKGICVMGARTLKTDRADRYINVRRSLNYIEAGLVDATGFAVFENNDQLLWDRIVNAASSFLGEYYFTGGLRGGVPAQAFYVVCNGDLNTETVIEQGQVIYEVGVSLQYPAEFVVIRVGQWSGGAAVTEV